MGETCVILTGAWRYSCLGAGAWNTWTRDTRLRGLDQDRRSGGSLRIEDNEWVLDKLARVSWFLGGASEVPSLRLFTLCGRR